MFSRLYKKRRVVLLALILVSVLLVPACSEPVRTITNQASFENRLQVGDLSIGYPDDMHEAQDVSENGAIPYSSETFGGAYIASARAVSKDSVVIILSAVEKDSESYLSDIDSDYDKLEAELGKTNEYGYTRLALERESVVVNGLDCIIVDTTIRQPEDLGGEAAQSIIYVLADENEKIVGSINAYFYADDYEKNSSFYDSVFASVERDTV